ncbi:MAG: outer membrane lipoprotein-sorting protein [Candidatus Nitrosotenuis sp.]
MLILIPLVMICQGIEWKNTASIALKDVSFQMVTISANRSELRKVSHEFALAYEASNMNVVYKDPMQIRLTWKMSGQSVIYIISNNKQVYQVPKINLLKINENISESPGKIQSLFDFGVLTNGIISQYLDGEYVQTEKESVFVFDAKYKQKGDSSRFRLWIDMEKRLIIKREWYNQFDKLIATFLYEEPARFDDIWFPTKLTIINADKKIAAISSYKDIRINQGIIDEIFKW